LASRKAGRRLLDDVRTRTLGETDLWPVAAESNEALGAAQHDPAATAPIHPQTAPEMVRTPSNRVLRIIHQDYAQTRQPPPHHAARPAQTRVILDRLAVEVLRPREGYSTVRWTEATARASTPALTLRA
jgi:hypothetical protein